MIKFSDPEMQDDFDKIDPSHKEEFKRRFEFIEIIRKSVLYPAISIDIHYVNSNPAIIDSIETVKVNSSIKKIKTSRKYNLESFTSNKLDIYTDINHLFIDSLNSNCSTIEVKYFDRGFFKNLLRRNINIITDNIKDCNWVITSKKIAGEILGIYDVSNINIPFIQGSVGKIGDAIVYVNCEVGDNEMYMGDQSSVTSIFNANVEMSSGDFPQDIKFEYLLLIDGVRKIIVK